MTTHALTCLIPTHNRPHFLRRLLAFYAQCPPKYPLVVVDSSQSPASGENLATVQSRQRELDITYRHFDTDFLSKCIHVLEQVQTPFIALCADDDVVFPLSAHTCVDFLGKNPGYTSAMGRVALLDPTLPTWTTTVLRGYSIENDDPLERCRRLGDVYFANFYGVFRTETLLQNYRTTATCTDASVNSFLPEMMLSQLSVLQGRVKVLPVMYCLMERHTQNAGARMNKEVRQQPELLFQRFKKGLTEECLKYGIQPGDAEPFIDYAFGCFRDPKGSVRGRHRSSQEKISYWLCSVRERIEDLIWSENNRHRRLLMSRDLKGVTKPWNVAVRWMQRYPEGIPSECEPIIRTDEDAVKNGSASLKLSA